MKKISILIPCYNEEENVREIAKAVEEQFEKELPAYNYEIIFIDNDSKDRTRDYLRVMTASDPRIKAILNTRNFGQFSSPYYGILQAHGDRRRLLSISVGPCDTSIKISSPRPRSSVISIPAGGVLS